MRSSISKLVILQYTILGGVVLYFARDILIPISFALLVSFMLHPIVSWMERKGIGRMTSILINVLILGLVFIAIALLLTKQIIDFSKEWPALQTSIRQSYIKLSETLIVTYGISQETILNWASDISSELTSGLMGLVRKTISFSAVSLVMMILIPVYVVLILYYRKLWVNVLERLFPNENTGDVRKILSLSIQAYYRFIKGMGLVYMAVGILNSLGLLLLGVPHAILFGLTASVLTFIPYVGIIVGSLLPITVAWVTYDSVWYPIGIIAIFTFVQYLEANLIFPFAVSNKLKINTLVTLVAIFAGGILWGIAGMILFVPFIGILKLVADNNPNLKTLSLALGTGK